MKHFLIILFVLLIGCVEYPEHAEIVTEPFDDSFADLTFTMTEPDDFSEVLFRIATVYSDGGYVVEVHLSEGVTMSEAAKHFFDEVVKYECHNNNNLTITSEDVGLSK